MLRVATLDLIEKITEMSWWFAFNGPDNFLVFGFDPRKGEYYPSDSQEKYCIISQINVSGKKGEMASNQDLQY